MARTTSRTVRTSKAKNTQVDELQPEPPVLHVPYHQKYRPQTFEEVIGQEAVVQTLINGVRLSRIASAYIFEGVRGTGKTSCGRILAKSLNCLAHSVPTVQPCGVCEVCQAITAGADLDVIEIDAASNTGVDSIRKVSEESHLLPMRARWRVWIIDEAHKLSTQAMNALLKTLEEPPERVVFVLATTEAEKLLPTIVSRCQRYRFGRISIKAMVTHLSWIAEQEGLQVEPDALYRIAQASDGGMRDAEKLLDQVSLLGERITGVMVDALTGALAEQTLLTLISGLLAPKPDVELGVWLINQVQALREQNKSPITVLEGLTRMVQLLLSAKYGSEPPRLTPVLAQTWQALEELAEEATTKKLRELNGMLRGAEPQIRQSASPQLWLEALMLDLAEASEKSD